MMMNYSEIIERVLENSGQKKENGSKIHSIRRDIEDTLVQMHGPKDEAPMKTVSFGVQKTKDVSNLTAQITIAPSASYTISDVNSVKSITISARNVILVAPSDAKTSELLVETKSHLGEVVNSQIIDLINVTVNTETLDLSLDDVVGGSIVLTVQNNHIDVIEVIVATIDYEVAYNSLLLPEDMFIPLEVKFTSSALENSTIYKSYELLAEEYMNWNAPPTSSGDEETDPAEVMSFGEDNLQVYFNTEENIAFDNSVGYYLEDADGRMYIKWKPAIDGVITIYYTYLPVINVKEDNNVNLHRCFIETVSSGASVRQLEKRLLVAGTEIEIARIRVVMGRYDKRYANGVVEYGGYIRRKTESHIIKPNSILTDSSMELY